MQSTGHGCQLHISSSCKNGHELPPYIAPDTIERVRILTPPPHDNEHAENDPHGETVQGTGGHTGKPHGGQSCELHVALWLCGPQPSPPCTGDCVGFTLFSGICYLKTAHPSGEGGGWGGAAAGGWGGAAAGGPRAGLQSTAI